ncbi:MAG: cupin domain-containing protein [Chloroflexota bacterium]|nr:cupin domain-containing protein [Chloroflexota bacterium]
MSDYFPDTQARQRYPLMDGVLTRTFWGQRMLCSLVELEVGCEVPRHAHPHEQVGFVLEGEVELTIGEERRWLRPGDLYIVPGGVEHAARVGEVPVRLLEVFSPIRADMQFV